MVNFSLQLNAKRSRERELISKLQVLEDDPHKETHGVLLSDEIESLARNHRLLEPFDPANLKPAAYELTVGDEYFQSGEFRHLTEESPTVTIPPFEVVVLQTAEMLCLPRFLIARWNIRVRHAYKGLLWLGGPQVDPGYKGHLSCPIYNLSDTPVTLSLGEQIAVVDFVKTTPFRSDVSKRYPEPQRVILEDYGIDDLRSALFTRGGQRIDEFDETIKSFEGRFLRFTELSFVILGLIVAAVALSVGGPNVAVGASFWGAVAMAMSTAALLIAMFSFVHWRVGRLVPERYGRFVAPSARTAQTFLRRSWYGGLAVCMVLAVAGGLLVYSYTEPFFTDVRQGRILTKSDLDAISDRISDIESKLTTADELEQMRLSILDEIARGRDGVPSAK